MKHVVAGLSLVLALCGWGEEAVFTAEAYLALDTRSSSPDFSAEATFNTRLVEWQGEPVVRKVLRTFRTSHPALSIPDEELVATLRRSAPQLLTFKPHSRLIAVCVRAKSPDLAAHLANAYADAIEEYTDEQNKKRCDRAAQLAHDLVEKQRRKFEACAKRLLDSRTKSRTPGAEPDVAAQMATAALEAEFERESHVLENLILAENKVRLDAEAGNELIFVVRRAVPCADL